MRRAPRSLGIAIGLVVVLVAAGGVVAPTPSHSGPPSLGSGALWRTDATTFSAEARSSALPARSWVPITLTMSSRDPGALARLAGAIVTPGDPAYHHYLTESNFVSRFAPTAGSVAQVTGFLHSLGARGVTVSSDRFSVHAELSAGRVDQAFATKLIGSRLAGWTATPVPSLPPSLRGIVVAGSGFGGVPVGSVSNVHALTAPRPVKEFVVDPASGENWFIGSDFDSAYNVTGLFPGSLTSNGTFASPSAVATLLLSGYNSSANVNLPPFDPAVIQSYWNDTFPAAWPRPVVEGFPVPIGSVTPPSPGAYGSVNDTTFNEEENSLDLEMAGSLAPGATLANFYLPDSLIDGPNASSSLGQVADDFATGLGLALDHNYSPARLTSVSCSFGLTDVNDTMWDSELLHAAVIGVTVVAASGDQADAPNSVSASGQGQWPVFPASAAFNSSGVVAVGGTSLELTGTPSGNETAGNLSPQYDPSAGAIASATAWYDSPQVYANASGTEGGASTVIGEPSWQRDSAAQPAIVNATVQQGLGSLGRAEPDIALNANRTIAYVSAFQGTVYFDVVEGTSVAAPLFAGMLAEMAAVAGHPFGFVDPELYRIGSYFAAHPSSADPFLDVTQGGNYVFSAGPGWDATTGWGQVNAGLFLKADASTAISGYTYIGPTPGLPPPSVAKPPPPLSPLVVDTIFIVLAIAVLVTVVAIVVSGRSRSGTVPSAPAHVAGTLPPAPAASPLPSSGQPAVFPCPYCGWPRPAEPVRCPSCGRL